MSKATQHTAYRTDWATPQWLFNYCNNRWGPFDVDMCASDSNKKHARYYSINNPCPTLKPVGVTRAWMNPPYGKGIADWLRVATNWSLDGAAVVALLPANTSSRWWHMWANTPTISDVFLLTPRVAFADPVGKRSAPVGGSCLFIFDAEIKDRYLSITKDLSRSSPRIHPLNLHAARNLAKTTGKELGGAK